MNIVNAQIKEEGPRTPESCVAKVDRCWSISAETIGIVCDVLRFLTGQQAQPELPTDHKSFSDELDHLFIAQEGLLKGMVRIKEELGA